MTPDVAIIPVLSPASPQARALLDLFSITLMVCAAILLIVTGSIAWCVARYGRRHDAAEPRQVAGNTKLEIGWTLASALVLLILFGLTVRTMRIADPPIDREPDVTVVGHQWWWEVRYRDGTVAANEIHIPTRSDVLVGVEAADVVHSFWVPQLGRKMDAIPGRTNHLWIRADEAGEYPGACSEFCGAQHAWMRILVVAQPRDEFRDWISHQASAAKPVSGPNASRGEQLFRSKTCVSCHEIRGLDNNTEVGPDLTHFASRKTIGAGVLQNNAANLRRWLTDPQRIKPGSRMPTFHLTAANLEDLSAFLETLQ
jgi:cytochrome c oxidase subunit 2